MNGMGAQSSRKRRAVNVRFQAFRNHSCTPATLAGRDMAFQPDGCPLSPQDILEPAFPQPAQLRSQFAPSEPAAGCQLLTRPAVRYIAWERQFCSRNGLSQTYQDGNQASGLDR